MCPKKLNSVTYKKSMLDSAVEAVMSGTFTMKQSASVYGVPVASISNTLRKKGYSSKKKKDVDQLAQIDKQLMDWLKLMSEISCFSLRNQMADIINEVFERFGQKVKLDGKSGQMQWIDRFVERQPEVLKASLEAESGVTGISSEHIDEWTRKLKNHLFHAHNIEVQEFAQQANAGNVFCCFEVGSVYFSGNKHSFRLLYKPSQGHVEGDFIMSLYSCICADGTFLKPVAIVKDETLIQTTMETGVRDFHILSSSEGKMSCEAAMLWMQLIDVETQPKKGHTSCLIFLDQTIRPLSLATLDFCRQRELILFYLPGHYPNMKLPFGMDIFYNLNGEYDNILSSDDAKDGEVTVESALELLMEAWKMMLKTNSNVTEFHDFGLVPLDSGVMKSTVEEIVPLTMSPTEGAFEAQEGAETPASSAHVPNTPSTDASSSSGFPNASLQSNDDIAVNLHPVRPARIPPKNYKETSETDNETEEPVEGILANTGMTVPTTAENVVSDLSALPKKPNLKMKIKRSERIPNTFSVEPDAILPSKQSGDGNNDGLSGRKASSDNFTSCDQCDKARDHGLRSGVVQGLVFALKRIESSLRADTLNLYKSRYLSPYLNDHRPSEPSFVMWCELMKCLEMGPDAVQKDFLLARSIQNNSGFEANSRECGSTSSFKSGSCLSDVTSDASVLPHRISKNKKRTRSPGLQESETLGVLSQNCFTRNDSAAFTNTVTGNILALHNVNDLSKPKTNKHDLHSTQTGQNQRLANGQTHGVSEREIADFNSNGHLNNSVHFPYKGFTPAASSGMKNQGRESFGSLHSEAQFSCNNQEPLDVSSAPDHREGMFTAGHKGAQGQNLEPHSLRPQFRPPRNVPPQAIHSPNQRPQFDSGPPIFHQQPQHSTPAGYPIQHQQFQRGHQSQQDPYSLLTKIDQTQLQKGWHPSQPNEPQESYASASPQQQQQQQQQHRMYQQLHHQERKDSCNASMQSKYDYQTGSSGVPTVAVHSENGAHTTQRTGDVSQEIIIDEPLILPCKSKIPGSHSVQQSCTPKKNITSPHVTSTPKSADSQTLASQVQRTPLPAAQSIESSQPSIVNNLNGSSNHDGGAAHLKANLQQHNRPLSSQYEIEDHPPVSNNQTSFSNSMPAHPSRPSVMPPPMNLSSSAHNLTDDGPSQLFVRGSEEQKHQQPGFRQDNVPRYQAHLPGNPGGDFNRSAYYPFSGRNQPPSTSSHVSSHHTFAPNSYGPNTTQTLASYNQTMPQTGGYSNGFNPNSNQQSHPTDFHLAYQFSGLQQHNQSPHQIPQHQQHQQHPQVQHLQQQQQQQHHQQQLLSQSQQHQHMQNSPNVLHMSATGHPAPLPASRAVEGGHTTSEIKVEQYTNL